MRDLLLVRTPTYLRTLKDLTTLSRHIRRLHGNSLVRHTVSNRPSNTICARRKTVNRQVFAMSQAWQSSQSSKRKYILHDTEEEVRILAHTHSDIGWGVRLAAENGYLSWMRNTYIMTLAGVAMINSEVAPLSPVAGSACFLVAAMNMTVGSLGFIYNLQRLYQEDHMSSAGAKICQVLTVLHLILWCSILLVFLPDLERATVALEKELEEMEKKDV